VRLASHGSFYIITGKTLTAEAVAELLEVPLYSVGAGELGVNADILEKRLRDILDTASQWGAILLIDEADVFLEQRSMHDVARNGLVSVFLRLLEYHQGILFLTTNRLKTIDSAFLSRFSIAVSLSLECT
jgi:SpoVK/Ycf46/Vps4 family AAA+-type ATPase